MKPIQIIGAWRLGPGGGAATFDNRGLATGKAHPANQPAASMGAYPTTGSGVSDPSADLTNPIGAPGMTLRAELGSRIGAWVVVCYVMAPPSFASGSSGAIYRIAVV